MKTQTLKRIIDTMEVREEKIHFMKVARPAGEIGKFIDTEVGLCGVINLSDEWVYIAVSIEQLREISAKNL